MRSLDSEREEPIPPGKNVSIIGQRFEGEVLMRNGG